MGLGAPAVFRKMRGEEVQFEKQCTFIAMPWLKIGVPREGGTHCDVYNFPDNRPPTPSTRCRWPSAAQGSSRSDTCPARRPTPTPSTTSIRTCCSAGKPCKRRPRSARCSPLPVPEELRHLSHSQVLQLVNQLDESGRNMLMQIRWP
ncbi:unnamed protein product [Vitrella brassicaformis CCMP3155]|uniref:Uncharacterized protein n=1 Tax=Vitrella brassicaformis (strain CCMP3155) TaxID=1169540 RepID=A0A0G4EBH2_VITBC|nr:unnamed protein product [Vitrella brassicaformis CCMP3155]|eukprot:CEL92866.1 unnamed protein product [Vitrella brassicaformis CCMP3155]